MKVLDRLFGGAERGVSRADAVLADPLIDRLVAATDKRLPGFVGDTLYQSTKRLAEYYGQFGLALERTSPAPLYRGKPVFIYHELRRLDARAR